MTDIRNGSDDNSPFAKKALCIRQCQLRIHQMLEDIVEDYTVEVVPRELQTLGKEAAKDAIDAVTGEVGGSRIWFDAPILCLEA
jgi:hypothetical protein